MLGEPAVYDLPLLCFFLNFPCYYNVTLVSGYHGKFTISIRKESFIF